MDERVERKLHRAVGLSDMAALLAAGFTFPTVELAEAVADGSFMSDWRASLADALGAVDESGMAPALRELHAHCDVALATEDAAFSALRREYSWLFLSPGAVVPVWPYESCFRHRALGKDGVPSIFNTRTALDVQRRMHESGAATVDEKTETCDSVYHELEFLSYLHACHAEALRVGDDERVRVTRQRLTEFAETHVFLWIPAFFERVVEISRSTAYRSLAKLGEVYMTELRAEVDPATAAMAE